MNQWNGDYRILPFSYQFGYQAANHVSYMSGKGIESEKSYFKTYSQDGILSSFFISSSLDTKITRDIIWNAISDIPGTDVKTYEIQTKLPDGESLDTNIKTLYSHIGSIIPKYDLFAEIVIHDKNRDILHPFPHAHIIIPRYRFKKGKFLESSYFPWAIIKKTLRDDWSIHKMPSLIDAECSKENEADEDLAIFEFESVFDADQPQELGHTQLLKKESHSSNIEKDSLETLSLSPEIHLFLLREQLKDAKERVISAEKREAEAHARAELYYSNMIALQNRLLSSPERQGIIRRLFSK